MIRAAFASLLALLLTGCWVGNLFYTQNDASQPVAEGQYKVVGQYPEKPGQSDEHDKTVRIRHASNGETIIDEKGEPLGILLSALPGVPGHFIGQQSIEKYRDGEGDPSAFYLLFEVRPGAVRVSLPNCKDTAEAIRPFDVRIEGSAVPTCQFPDRATLEAAMKIYAAKPDNWIELKRIGD